MSSKPSKVRLRMFTAPLHKKSSWVRAPLSDELRTKYGVRSLRVRKGDSVKIMRGEYKGVEGKVTDIDPRSARVTVEGVTREKVAGGTVPVKIHASNVMVTSVNLEDKWRKRRLEGVAEERGGKP